MTRINKDLNNKCILYYTLWELKSQWLTATLSFVQLFESSNGLKKKEKKERK